jgi:hypothetical protein
MAKLLPALRFACSRVLSIERVLELRQECDCLFSFGVGDGWIT